MNKLSNEYIAGFFDGEGCVTIGRSSTVPAIVGQKDPAILSAIHAHFGGNLRQEKLGHWTLRWSCRTALPVLEAIHPHLIGKRRKVWLAMRLIKFYRPRGHYRGYILSDKERRLRWRIADVLQGGPGG